MPLLVSGWIVANGAGSLASYVTPADGIALGAAGSLVTLLLLGWMLVGEPLVGHHSYKRFLARLAAGVPGVRLKLYLSWSAMAWTLALIVLLLAGLAPGFGLQRLGLRRPDFERLLESNFALAIVAGALLGLLTSTVMVVREARRSSRHGRTATNGAPSEAVGGGAPVAPALGPGGDSLLALLPRTPRERAGFALLSVTAGITEEIVWRGFLIAALVAFLPPLQPLLYVAIAAGVFGLAHLYQGPVRMLLTGCVGALLTGIYLATGSLVVPIVLHALIDLRALLIQPDAGRARGAEV